MGVRLPSLPIGRYIGDIVSKSGESGSKLVNTARDVIDVVKDAKLQLKPILKDAGEAAVNAAAARVHEGLNQAKNRKIVETLQESAVPILLGVLLLTLILMRRR
jgi:hypothetical protein